MHFTATEAIKHKKHGEAHSKEELFWLIEEFTKGNIPDYQMSAWTMAVCFQGLNTDEVAWFTAAMRDSGQKMNFSHLDAPRVDKHSTGGVGDKTSIVLGPIMAAAEIYCPMIAGRALAHTGGTLDKLESIPGFRIHLSRDEYQKNVEEHFFSIMGQTKEICPADRKLYSLRDVTSTVDSLELICGSIMSKKLAEDLTGLVLDIKFGSGAFMKTLEDAEKLGRLLQDTGKKNGVDVHVLITNMDEPLGRFSGNACEIQECVDVLQNKTCVEGDRDWYSDTRELSLRLASHMMVLGQKSENVEQGYALATELLESGKAWSAFERLLEYQGPCQIENLPAPAHSAVVEASESGVFERVDTELLGLAGVELGIGRKKVTDPVDHSAGIEHLARPGDAIKAGQPIYRLFSSRKQGLEDALPMAQKAIKLTKFSNLKTLPLVAKVLT